MPGYSDYQRIVNWDGPAVWEILTTKVTGTAESAMVDCSRYGYILGRAFIGENPFRLNFKWFADEAGTKQVGESWIELNNNVTQPVQLRIPNKGPWVRVSLEGESGETKGLATVRLLLTNRTDPLTVIPRQPLLIFARKEAAGAEVLTVFPTDCFAGPVIIHLEAEGQNVNVFLEVQTGPGQFRTTDFIQCPATSTEVTQRVITPPGAWKLTVVAAPGKNANLTAFASMTGSS